MHNFQWKQIWGGSAHMRRVCHFFLRDSRSC